STTTNAPSSGSNTQAPHPSNPTGNPTGNATGNSRKSAPSGNQSERASATQSYAKFSTTFPSVIGDPSLMPLLQEQHVLINVVASSTPWFALLLSYGLPLLLMLGLLVWMGQQASKTQTGIFGFARNRARRYAADRPKVTFADVAGADEAK